LQKFCYVTFKISCKLNLHVTTIAIEYLYIRVKKQISDTYCIVLPCAVGLPRVRKPNVRMEFNVYVNSQSDASVQHRRVCDSLFLFTHHGMLGYICITQLYKGICSDNAKLSNEIITCEYENSE